MVIITAQGRDEQKRNDGGQEHEREGEQDVQPGLPAHGADVAAGEEQDGLHTNRLGRTARHNVQRSPTARVHV